MKTSALSPLILLILPCAACGTATTPSVDAGSDLAIGPDLAMTYAQVVTATPWTLLPKGPKVTQGKQDDIFFTTPLHGFAVSGPSSKVYRTDDGGTTWTTVLSMPGTYFRSVLFVDDNHGFASNLGPIPMSGITDTNILYETKDTGATWKPVTAITGPMPTGICNQTMIDSMNLVAVGRVNGPSYFMRSSDAGATWTSTSLNTQLSMLIDAHFVSAMEGIVVGGSASMPMRCTILRTTDGAMTWKSVFSSTVDNSLCWKISFPSAMVGYVSVQDTASGPGTFAKTIDGGMTWIEKPLMADGYDSIGIGFITESIGWVSGEDPTDDAYRTLDGGETWTVEKSLAPPINRFRFINPQTAYAIGASTYKLNVNWMGN